MGKKKEKIEGQNVAKSSTSKLPLLIFLIGLLLIVAGFMMDRGYIGGGTVTPEKEATEQNDDKTTKEDNTTEENKNVVAITEGVAFVLDPTKNYSYLDGAVFIYATEINSTGAATDSAKVFIVEGGDNPVTLTPTAPTATVNNITITATKWENGEVTVTVTGTATPTATDTTNDTTTDNTTDTTTDTTNNQ